VSTTDNSFAKTRAWSERYHGELRRLEAAKGVWSREIADQARAFADGNSVTAVTTSTKPAPRPPSDAAADGAAWARTLGITYGSKPAPAASSVDADAVDWDEAFGKEPAAAPAPSPAPKPEAADFDWDAAIDQHNAERTAR
jgi:hypothetical protein